MMSTTTATTNDIFYGSRLGQLESNNWKELSKSSCGGAPRIRGLPTTRHLNPFCILRHAILRVDYLILYYISTLDLMSFSFFCRIGYPTWRFSRLWSQPWSTILITLAQQTIFTLTRALTLHSSTMTGQFLRIITCQLFSGLLILLLYI